MFLYFYHALETQKIRYWLITGVTAGLAMMAKYYSGLPILVMFLFICTQKQGRISFRFSGIYGCMLSFILIILPHIVWLFQHDFLTVRYAFNRAGNQGANFIGFGFSQMLDFLIPLVILLYFKYKNYQASFSISNISSISVFNKNFLVWMSLGPFLLTVLLAGLFQRHVYNEWGAPLVSLWGLYLLCLIKPVFTPRLFKKFLILSYILMFLWAVGYTAGLYLDNKRKHSDNYPAQDIADYVTQQWQTHYHKPLKYIAGSRYIGGYILFYSPYHPSVLAEWEPDFSSHINMQDFNQYGAVFVQDNYYGTTVFGQHPETHQGLQFPKEVLQKYPRLIILPVKYFYFKRVAHTPDKAIPVLMGFLPPLN